MRASVTKYCFFLIKFKWVSARAAETYLPLPPSVSWKDFGTLQCKHCLGNVIQFFTIPSDVAPNGNQCGSLNSASFWHPILLLPLPITCPPCHPPCPQFNQALHATILMVTFESYTPSCLCDDLIDTLKHLCSAFFAGSVTVTLGQSNDWMRPKQYSFVSRSFTVNMHLSSFILGFVTTLFTLLLATLSTSQSFCVLIAPWLQTSQTATLDTESWGLQIWESRNKNTNIGSIMPQITTRSWVVTNTLPTL